MERRLAAILAADMVGYSRLMGEDEAGTLAAYQRHRRELITPRAIQYHGRICKLTGDGALMEFASVVDAVRFAVEVQLSLRDENANRPWKDSTAIGSASTSATSSSSRKTSMAMA